MHFEDRLLQKTLSIAENLVNRLIQYFETIRSSTERNM